MGAVLGRMPMPEAKLIKAVVDDVFATQLLSARAQTAEAPAAAPPRQSFLSHAVAALFRLNNGELVPSGEAGRPAAAVQALPLQHVAAPTSEREAFRVELLNLIENSLRRDADTHTAALLQSYQGHLESLAEPFSTGLSADVQERGAALGRRLHQRVTALRQRFPDVVMQPPLLAQLRGGKEAVDIVRRDAATEKSADACGYYCNNTSGATCSRGGTVGCMYGGGPAWGPNGVRVEGDGRGAKGRCKTKGHCAPRKRDGELLFCCEHYPDGVPAPPPAAAASAPLAEPEIVRTAPQRAFAAPVRQPNKQLLLTVTHEVGLRVLRQHCGSLLRFLWRSAVSRDLVSIIETQRRPLPVRGGSLDSWMSVLQPVSFLTVKETPKVESMTWDLLRKACDANPSKPGSEDMLCGAPNAFGGAQCPLNSMRRVFSGYDIVTGRQKATLDRMKSAYLDDNIINTFCQRLKELAGGCYIILGTHFLTALTEHGYDYSRVSRWVTEKKLDGVLLSHFVGGVLAPYNLNLDHWVWLWAIPLQRKLFVINPSSGRGAGAAPLALDEVDRRLLETGVRLLTIPTHSSLIRTIRADLLHDAEGFLQVLRRLCAEDRGCGRIRTHCHRWR